MKNRGPDASAMHQEDGLELGFHRLAIHDTSIMGMQPFTMADEKSNYFLLCNGEIYNHRELCEYGYMRRGASDCEILLPLFLHLKKDMAQFLEVVRGEFAVIIVEQDRATRQVISCWGASDPLGVRPLFYSVVGGCLTGMASLAKGLSGHVIRHNPSTWLYHDCKKKNVMIMPMIYPIARNPQKNLLYVLRECIVLRLSSDRPIGCLLSGGLDSSLVAALTAIELRKSGQMLRTFSIGMEGATDLGYARLVSEHIQSHHTEFIITEKEALEAIPAVIRDIESYDVTTVRASVPQWLLGKKIRSQTDIRVILNGDGADECMMGYLYFHKAPSLQEAIQERDRLLQDIHLFDGLRADRCMSCHGLEPRMPYLDSQFVSCCRKLEGELLAPMGKQQEKHFIRQMVFEHMPDLLPPIVLWRKKEAFSDGISPIKRSWFEMIQESIHDMTEAQHYRKIFEKHHPEREHLIPYQWMPRWTDATDPSARTLDLYKTSDLSMAEDKSCCSRSNRTPTCQQIHSKLTSTTTY